MTMTTFDDPRRFGCVAMASALFFAATPGFSQQVKTGLKSCDKPNPTPAEGEDCKGQTLVSKAQKKAPKDQFRDYGKALLHFEAAIRLDPSQWWLYAHKARCLELLERYDEAFETYNFMVAEHEKEIDKEHRDKVDQFITWLRPRIATVTLTVAEPGVMVFIDGRMKFDARAKQAQPFAPISISVMPGPHLVRVYKAGFEVHDQDVDIGEGKPESLVMGLTEIKDDDAAYLAIPEIPGRTMEVLVDGIPVGTTPMKEVRVKHGAHSVSFRLVSLPQDAPRDTCDSGPKAAAIVNDPDDAGLATEPIPTHLARGERQTIKVKPEQLQQLKAVLRIEPDPPDAEVYIDENPVGTGLYVARTKSGKHRVKIVANGYLAGKEEEVMAIDGEETAKKMVLEKDLNASRWGRRRKVLVEAFGGVSLAPSFGGDLAAECTNDCQESLGLGPRAGLRVGYESARGFGVGLSAGYLQMKQTRTGVSATLSEKDTNAPLKGTANDTTSMKTFAIGAYGSYKLGERFPLRLGLGAGVLLGNVTYERVALFEDSTALAGPLTQSAFLPWIYVEPEARIGVQITEGLSIGINISGMVLIAPNIPTWNRTMEVKVRREDTSTVRGFFPQKTLTDGVFFTMNQSLYVQYGF